VIFDFKIKSEFHPKPGNVPYITLRQNSAESHA